MSKESKTNKRSDVLTKLREARWLLDECIAGLQGQARLKSAKAPAESARPSRGSHAPRNLDFETNERAFVKAHAQDLSGPKKFVLLVAFLAKGKAGVDVDLKAVEGHWNKMTAPNLLDGKFNRFYTNAAKENGWVNTKKKGVYFLRPQWRDIF